MPTINLIEKNTRALRTDFDRLEALADSATRALHAGDAKRYGELVDAYQAILDSASDQISGLTFLARRAKAAS
jgi:mevalonate kinase